MTSSRQGHQLNMLFTTSEHDESCVSAISQMQCILALQHNIAIFPTSFTLQVMEHGLGAPIRMSHHLTRKAMGQRYTLHSTDIDHMAMGQHEVVHLSARPADTLPKHHRETPTAARIQHRMPLSNFESTCQSSQHSKTSSTFSCHNAAYYRADASCCL
mmetsp:Transcript_38246/g.63254  ORF Transcript_38246/g.63254 Transcript_38246/m.63254 type:complete len:158 (+) Transcript_38246:680-1153(+)